METARMSTTSNFVTQPSAAAKSKQSWWTSLVFICAILGALLALSVKSRDVIRRENLPAQNYPALAQEYIILKQKALEDSRQLALQSQQLSNIESSTSSSSSEQRALLSDLEHTKFEAGLTAAVGPGLLVTLNDSKMPLPIGWPAGAAPPNLIHDTDINEVVNELKAAGAEAIAVNGQRLIATSPIRCAGPTVFVNNTPETPPYVIQAIGPPKTMETAINLPGGVGSQMRDFDPAMISLKTSSHILVPASPGPPPPVYARPVAAAPDSGQSSQGR